MDESQGPQRLKVYICYATEDIEQVEMLYKELEVLGFEPFLDSKMDHPGMRLDHFISSGMESADAIIICLSSVSVHKVGYVQVEIKKALRLLDRHPSQDIFLIPVLLDECTIPRDIIDTGITYQEMYEENGLNKLIQALNTRSCQLSKLTTTFRGLTDMPGDMLVSLIGNAASDRSVAILQALCKKIQKGEIPVEILVGLSKHPYWLIRRIAIEKIVSSGATNTLELLFEFRTVRYWQSQDIIRKWIRQRLESNVISLMEMEIMEELVLSLSRVERISDQTRDKDWKLINEIRERKEKQ